MKQIVAILTAAILSTSANAAVFWTVKAEHGITTSSEGTAAINLGNYIPTAPNPSGEVVAKRPTLTMGFTLKICT